MPSASRGRQGQPVVYSVDAHREFVTGFRQRKLQRRQKAQKLAAEKQKKERREERKQRRDVFRANREKIQVDSEEESVDGDASIQSTQFRGADGVVTAVVQPLSFGKPATFPQQPQQTVTPKSQTGSQQSESTKGTKSLPAKLGVVKMTKKSWNRKISYTHMLSKGNLRKAKLRRRREARKNAS